VVIGLNFYRLPLAPSFRGEGMNGRDSLPVVLALYVLL
jgi:hypothetical protein